AIIGRANTGPARRIPLTDSCGFPLLPTPLAVKAEDYPLALPVLILTPKRRLPLLTRDFLDFLRSPAAQEVILAAGYIDREGGITGWLSELASVPVDANPQNGPDEWSGDFGCGSRYFSQEAVIRLAPAAGVRLEETLSPAEKLCEAQRLLAEGNDGARRIFASIGACLGHSLAYYYDLYGCESVLLMGRVVSGEGGDILLEKAREVLAGEYPEVAERLSVALPDEASRRVGQSVAAASL
ncbi:MAG TPA: hypothetical protein PLP20_01260, partial [Oscillospiraceae bacterium]|nr:hypothetical protein [Oscillospiraceae bacterium]